MDEEEFNKMMDIMESKLNDLQRQYEHSLAQSIEMRRMRVHNDVLEMSLYTQWLSMLKDGRTTELRESIEKVRDHLRSQAGER